MKDQVVIGVARVDVVLDSVTLDRLITHRTRVSCGAGAGVDQPNDCYRQATFLDALLNAHSQLALRQDCLGIHTLPVPPGLLLFDCPRQLTPISGRAHRVSTGVPEGIAPPHPAGFHPRWLERRAVALAGRARPSPSHPYPGLGSRNGDSAPRAGPGCGVRRSAAPPARHGPVTHGPLLARRRRDGAE